MSHIVSIQTEIRDPVAIRSACDRLHLPKPVFGKTQLFNSSATGWAVQLPEWRYPVVCDVATSTIAYDNFEGRWGDRQYLDQFLQAYAVERATSLARMKGHSVIEQSLENGSVKLTISVAGGV